MINKEKIKNVLGIYSYGDACGYAVVLIAIIGLIIFSCFYPIARIVIMSVIIMITVIYSLGYIIYKLLN